MLAMHVCIRTYIRTKIRSFKQPSVEMEVEVAKLKAKNSTGWTVAKSTAKNSMERMS